MSKKENGRWDEFKFKEGVNYSQEEVVKVIDKMRSYLKENQIRFDILMIISPEKWRGKFVLSDTEFSKYKNYFRNKKFTEDGVKVSMDCLSYIFHSFDVSLDKALEVVEYAMLNGHVISKAIKDKLGTDLNEINDFSDDVLLHNIKFCMSQSLDYLMKIEKMFIKK